MATAPPTKRTGDSLTPRSSRRSTRHAQRLATASLTCGLRTKTAHQEVRALDDGGDYDGAVELATGPVADTFVAFTTPIRDARTEEAAAAVAAFDDAQATARDPAVVRARRRADRRGHGRRGLRATAQGVPVIRRPLVAPLLLLATIAACGAPQLAAPPEVTAPATTTTEVTAPPECTAEEAALDATRSYAPEGELPPPGEMPAGSTMAEIQANGRLRVGVSAGTLQFGFLNPQSGELEGFDIDDPRGGRPGDLRRCRPPADRLSGDELRRAPPRVGGRRGRPRRPHDDDQLQPVVAHRVLVHLLRRRPEGARADRRRASRASRTSSTPGPGSV